MRDDLNWKVDIFLNKQTIINQGKYIFAQLTDYLQLREFDCIVKEHKCNKYFKTFTCGNQGFCMVFGQLTSRDSMRDFMLSIVAHQSILS